MSLSERLAGLDGIGFSDGGIERLAWSEEARATGAWFERQAAGCGLRVLSDPAGNLWAVPDTDPPWFALGSHLDSVRGGGRFDGPLGVACGFELASRSERPLAVISFADEEGARFNTPTFGSKALAGRLDLPAVLDRRDGDGITVADAMQNAGVDPGGLDRAPSWLAKLSGFVEIHIDQSTELERAGVAVGVVRSLAHRLRIEFEIHGRADHAGTTPPAERRDALLAAARMIVAADEIGRELGDLTVTASRIVVEPNASTTIASLVRLWVDARSADAAQIDAWLGRVRTVDPGAPFELSIASRGAGREFSAELRNALASAAREVLGRPVPELVCFAGHDAGVIGEHIPAAMLLVRNPTGVSHSPAESIDLDDAELAVQTVLGAIA